MSSDDISAWARTAKTAYGSPPAMDKMNELPSGIRPLAALILLLLACVIGFAMYLAS